MMPHTLSIASPREPRPRSRAGGAAARGGARSRQARKEVSLDHWLRPKVAHHVAQAKGGGGGRGDIMKFSRGSRRRESLIADLILRWSAPG